MRRRVGVRGPATAIAFATELEPGSIVSFEITPVHVLRSRVTSVVDAPRRPAPRGFTNIGCMLFEEADCFIAVLEGPGPRAEPLPVVRLVEPGSLSQGDKLELRASSTMRPLEVGRVFPGRHVLMYKRGPPVTKPGDCGAAVVLVSQDHAAQEIVGMHTTNGSCVLLHALVRIAVEGPLRTWEDAVGALRG